MKKVMRYRLLKAFKIFCISWMTLSTVWILNTILCVDKESVSSTASTTYIKETRKPFVNKILLRQEHEASIKKFQPLSNFTEKVVHRNHRKVRILNTEQQYYKIQSKMVNPHNHTVLLTSSVCDSHNPPYLIIFVFSTASKGDVRSAIRQTWGSVDMNKNKTWPGGRNILRKTRILFVLGNVKGQANRDLKLESDKHGDLIQEDFIDSYLNLTLKSVMTLKWATINCPSAKFFMKTDDDMFINIPPLIEFLAEKENSLDAKIVGSILNGAKVYRTGKWSVKVETFPFSRYPTYAAGNGYVLSIKLAKQIYQASLYMPILNIEDVFITGICARVVGGVTHYKHIGFTNWLGKPPTMCEIVTDKTITATKMTAKTLRSLWIDIKTNFTNNKHGKICKKDG